MGVTIFFLPLYVGTYFEIGLGVGALTFKPGKTHLGGDIRISTNAFLPYINMAITWGDSKIEVDSLRRKTTYFDVSLHRRITRLGYPKIFLVGGLGVGYHFYRFEDYKALPRWRVRKYRETNLEYHSFLMLEYETKLMSTPMLFFLELKYSFIQNERWNDNLAVLKEGKNCLSLYVGEIFPIGLLSD